MIKLRSLLFSALPLIVFATLTGCASTEVKKEPIKTSNLNQAQNKTPNLNQAQNKTLIKMAGEWTFVSSNTGRKYRGDVRLDVWETNGSGKMQGIVYFDGRQTNDICSTKSIWNPGPAKAYVEKRPTGYYVSFKTNCSVGKSPRLKEWELTCENGVCTRPEVLPHGKGILKLKES